MFRATFSIILLFAFAVQTFHKGGIVVSYYLNKDAYAKNCVNKAKPVLKCSGKCQMVKKILEQQKQDEQAPERKLENKFQSLWSMCYFATLTIHNSLPTHCYNFYSDESVLSTHPEAIFHPPCLL